MKCGEYVRLPLPNEWRSNIMRPERFRAESIVSLLQKQRVATMDRIKDALGTRVDMTVFRKLRQIAYVRSYSDRGKYYALRERADFDARGLWTHRGVRFSQFGSLVNTVEQFALRADRGCAASELVAELGVEVNGPLVQLARSGRLRRERVAGVYVYGSPTKTRHAEQIATRQQESTERILGATRAKEVTTTDEAKAAILLFMSVLDEKQRRLYAGLESMLIGRGGDRRLAELTGLDVHTIGKGRKELQEGDLDSGSIRRSGGGRKLVEKKRQTSSKRSQG